jgi:hypothetical protein
VRSKNPGRYESFYRLDAAELAVAVEDVVMLLDRQKNRRRKALHDLYDPSVVLVRYDLG